MADFSKWTWFFRCKSLDELVGWWIIPECGSFQQAPETEYIATWLFFVCFRLRVPRHWKDLPAMIHATKGYHWNHLKVWFHMLCLVVAIVSCFLLFICCLFICLLVVFLLPLSPLSASRCGGHLARPSTPESSSLAVPQRGLPHISWGRAR